MKKAAKRVPAVRRPLDLLGVETYQRVVRHVLKPMAQESPVFSNNRRHRRSGIDPELDARLCGVAIVDFDGSVDSGEAEGDVQFRFSVIRGRVGGEFRIRVATVYLP